MKITNIRDLLIHEIQDLYSAETQLVKALPEMADKASSESLKQALDNHLEETKGQVTRLEQIAKKLGIQVKGKPCKAMQGLIEEGKEILKDGVEGPALDAAIIVAAQKVEHYEIAGYGSISAFAEELGEQEVMELLEETLEEESNANEILDGIAIDEVNPQALPDSIGPDQVGNL